MNNKNDYKKIVLHLSPEMVQRMDNASSKQKLSFGSIVREAIKRYLDEIERKK